MAAMVALGLGVAIASLEVAARTDHAYPSYLRRARVSELVVNPSFNTTRADEVVRATPGILSVASDALLTATVDDGAPRSRAGADADGTQVLMSGDGRYVAQDRPAVRDGRMIGRGAEAFVNVEMAEALDLRVGDMLPLAFWGGDYSGAGPGEGAVLEPLGRTRVRVVGIGVFADEVLRDGLYPRRRVLVTPEVAKEFDCMLALPDAGDARSLDEIGASIVPPNCATTYRYYSLRVAGGDDGVGRLTDALAERFAQENERLPAALRDEGIGFEVVPTVTADERRRVQRSLQPAVRALQLFGAAAAVSTVVVVLLCALRLARRDEQDASVWHALGAGRALRSAAIAAPLAVAASAGLAGSVVVAWLASGLGPVASARSIEAPGRLGLSGPPVLVVVGLSSVVLAAGLVAAAVAVSSHRPPARPAAPSRSRLLGRVGRPPFTLGSRAAVAGAGSRALLAASVMAVGALVAASVFSASLSGLVSRPDRFGWPYDVAAMLNFGYGGSTDLPAVAATLDRPDVENWGAAIVATLQIGDESVPFVAARSGFDTMPLPVVEGALPATADEIALGSLTAERLGIGVGDTTVVKTQFGEREATVRGLVVLPPIGPFLSDRASLGSGALLSKKFVDALQSDAGVAPEEPEDPFAGFVAVDLRDGVDAERFVAAISGELSGWDTSGTRPFVYAAPVRPATVANVAAMRAVPVLLAGLLGLTMAIGLAVVVGAAARARRRELALLRAFGFVGRQLRATVRWQALTVVGVGLLVGIPLGVAAGRATYGAFAGGLGVRPDAVVSPRWMLVLVVATGAVGLLAAAGPGYRATRVTAAEALRKE